MQIAGADPAQMADAARLNAEEGAQIIDINMGCPAKKVCNVAAGSALLSDEALVGRILEAVVAAVDVPVTLKIRTGPDPARRNALRIARIAESAGVRLLAVHGRTRACGFRGEAEFETVAEVKAGVRIPVIANGDIATPEEAQRVLDATRADGIMIGRAAHGRPWIFREFAFPRTRGKCFRPPFAGGDARGRARAPRRHLRPLRRGAGPAHRAQAHRLVHARAAGRREPFAAKAMTICRRAEQLAAVGRFFDGLRAASPAMSRNTELADAVKRSLERYFRDMDGERPTAIYDMVLKNIERPLIETVLGKAEGNQSAAAAMLGIDRNTLRKKIQQLRIKA